MSENLSIETCIVLSSSAFFNHKQFELNDFQINRTAI
jgi:hypothetical protein